MYYLIRLFRQGNAKPTEDNASSSTIGDNENPSPKAGGITAKEKEANMADGASMLATVKEALETVWKWSTLICMCALPSAVPFRLLYVAFLSAFCLGMIVLLAEWMKWRAGLVRVFPKYLDVGLPIINLALTIGVLLSPPPQDWQHTVYIGGIVNACLFAFGVVTVALGQPFTLQYAKDKVPESLWDSPSFYKISLHITLLWCAIWGVTAIFDFIVSVHLQRHWTRNLNLVALVVPLVLLGLAFRLTAWYPAYMRTKRSAAAREDAGSAGGAAGDKDTAPGAGGAEMPERSSMRASLLEEGALMSSSNGNGKEAVAGDVAPTGQ